MTAIAPERHLTGPAPRPQVVLLSQARRAVAAMHASLDVTPDPVDAFTGDAALAFMVLHLQASGYEVILDDLTPDEALVLAEMQQRANVTSLAYPLGVA